ncbi:hypothetical protein PSPO01_02538 [Paraphaeosphaeria sporulosa]
MPWAVSGAGNSRSSAARARVREGGEQQGSRASGCKHLPDGCLDGARHGAAWRAGAARRAESECRETSVGALEAGGGFSGQCWARVARQRVPRRTAVGNATIHPLRGGARNGSQAVPRASVRGRSTA